MKVNDTTVPPAPVYVVAVCKLASKAHSAPEALANSHQLKGYAASLPVIGEPWFVLRTETNGRTALGTFTTSAVRSVLHDSAAQTVRVETENSTWVITYVVDTTGSIVVDMGSDASQASH